MSDATTTEATPDAGLAGMTVTTELLGQGSTARECLRVTWGDPRRSILLKQLTLGEQFDLAETTGPNADNAVWVNMATVAASVSDIDGVPPRPGLSRQDLKMTLDRLKVDGLRAGMMALNGYRGADATPQAAPETAEAHKQSVGN